MSSKGIASANRRNKDVKMAADMAKAGIKRTSFRDPITNKMVPMGTYPGMAGAKIKG